MERGQHSHPKQEFGAMFDDRSTARLIAAACHARWPGRHIAGAAELMECSKTAVAFWLSGRRRMSAAKMTKLATSLIESSDLLRDLARGIAFAAEKARGRGRRRRGFEIVKDWDGRGIVSDRRWRQGRSKKR